MGKSPKPIKLCLPHELAETPFMQEKRAQGHQIDVVPDGLTDYDFVVLYPEYGVFEKVIWAEAVRRNRLKSKGKEE